MLHRARHMDPEASSSRDQHAGMLGAAHVISTLGCLAGRSDSFEGGGVQGGRGPEGI